MSLRLPALLAQTESPLATDETGCCLVAELCRQQASQQTNGYMALPT
jgi:hypothetical protein